MLLCETDTNEEELKKNETEKPHRIPILSEIKSGPVQMNTEMQMIRQLKIPVLEGLFFPTGSVDLWRRLQQLGKTVHPIIVWNSWRSSRHYRWFGLHSYGRSLFLRSASTWTPIKLLQPGRFGSDHHTSGLCLLLQASEACRNHLNCSKWEISEYNCVRLLLTARGALVM